MKKILVSGGAGFVGRHLVQSVAGEQDTETWIIDDLSIGTHPSQWEIAPATMISDSGGVELHRLESGITVHFIRANFAAVCGAELGVTPALGLQTLPQFDEVYHLASIVGGRSLIEGHPLKVGLDLAIDSLFFLWAAEVNRPKRILCASSSAAYPISLQTDVRHLALSETMIDFDAGVLAPDFTYGWSKLTSEYLARVAVERYGLSVAIVRPFSGYGEDQDSTYPVPAIALRVAARQDPVRIWGSGTQGRDFVHISDCVLGMKLACRNVSDGTAFNLGSGDLTSFVDLAHLMLDIEGYAAEVRPTENRPVGVAHRYADTRRSRELLGWVPLVDLREGMSRVLRHARIRLGTGVLPPP